MNLFIINALDYYNTITKIDKDKEIKFTDELHNFLPICYIKENDKFTKKMYNIIGYYLYDYEQFIWAWYTNTKSDLYVKTKQLVLHGINTEPITMSDLYIKKILTSNKIKTKNDNLLEIILAISCYLTKGHGYLIRKDNNTNYMVFYVFYDIKDIELLNKTEKL